MSAIARSDPLNMTETLQAKRWVAARWAPIPLRLIVGFGFVAHGYAKLVKGPYVFVGILHALGVPAPYFMAWLTILIELFSGLAVLLGALVPLVSLPMAAVLLVAMFTVHLPFGFTSIKLMAVTPEGPLGHLAMKPTSYTWPAWPPSLWVAPGRGRSTGLLQTDCGDGRIPDRCRNPNRFVVFDPEPTTNSQYRTNDVQRVSTIYSRDGPRHLQVPRRDREING
jgi:uncharacterized membrane protein YphA (DoxX/SURF4 family)